MLKLVEATANDQSFTHLAVASCYWLVEAAKDRRQDKLLVLPNFQDLISCLRSRDFFNFWSRLINLNKNWWFLISSRFISVLYHLESSRISYRGRLKSFRLIVVASSLQTALNVLGL